MSVSVTLYKYTGDKYVLNKGYTSGNTSRLTPLANDPLTCALYEPFTLEEPALILTYNESYFRDCNYIYIDNFKRYYFVTARMSNAGGQMIFSCKSDVLTNAGADLLTIPLTVTRATTANGKPTLIRDTRLPLALSRNVKTYEFSESPFNTGTAGDTDYNFVLNVAGKEVT